MLGGLLWVFLPARGQNTLLLCEGRSHFESGFLASVCLPVVQVFSAVPSVSRRPDREASSPAGTSQSSEHGIPENNKTVCYTGKIFRRVSKLKKGLIFITVNH